MRYFIIIFLFLGALYVSWHFGRYYEKQEYSVLAKGTISIPSLSVKGALWIPKEEFDRLIRWREIALEQKELITICNAIVNELENPAPRGLWTQKFKEFKKQ